MTLARRCWCWHTSSRTSRFSYGNSYAIVCLMDTAVMPRAWTQALLRHVLKASQHDCWLWQGPRNKAGYGLIYWTQAPGRRTCTTAHRAMLIAYSGPPIDPSMEAMHTCDNPPCCNPLHLRWGSRQANSDDAARKGRLLIAGGRKKPTAHTRVRKLTDDMVRAIRASTDDSRDIARMFGITRLTVYNIKARRRKGSVPD